MRSTYAEWESQVHSNIVDSPLWGLMVYRSSLYLADLAWFDSESLSKAPQGRSLAWQLVRSAGSVAANIEEGYGRGLGTS